MTPSSTGFTYSKLRLICIAMTAVGIILLIVLYALYQLNPENLQLIQEQNIEQKDLLFYLLLGVGIISSLSVPPIMKTSMKQQPTTSIQQHYGRQIVIFAIYPTSFIYGFIISIITPFEYRNLIFFALGFILCFIFFPKEISESEFKSSQTH